MPIQVEKVVQWYPGHMAAAMRKIGEYLKLVDAVVEVADARIPRSGRNPMLDALIGNRTRILALAREDLAEPAATRAWIERFVRSGLPALAIDARSRGSVSHLATALERATRERTGTTRVLIVGVPNSGKSTTINALLHRAAARTEDRAGITRQLQWFRLSDRAEVMDSPGILVPKIATPAAQWMLALCGALPQDRYDAEHVTDEFHRWLLARRPNTGVPTLEAFATERGIVRRGGAIDFHNAARSYVRAFNAGTFGRLTLEMPDAA